MTVTCPWYRRWWHRRLRKADRALIVPLFKTVHGFWLFTSQRGQEHWRCPCGETERIDVEDSFARTVEDAFDR